MTRLALAALLALLSFSARAQDGAPDGAQNNPQAQGAVSLPLAPQAERFDYAPAAPFSIAPGVELVIEGEALGPTAQRVTLRIDDAAARDYATRVNDERLLPPGPFTWRILPAGARTSEGRALDADRITRITLFPAQADARLTIHAAHLRAPSSLPDGAQGFSFGARDAPLFPGFARVAPGDPRIEAGLSQPILRPGVDALIASGLRGVERARLPWAKGRARVSLWIEDVGEWETLPHAFERRVRVNGVDLYARRLTPEQWIAQIYLAGRNAEPNADIDAWRVHGARRGGLVTGEVDVGDHGVVIELAGESANSAFLAAALIEPAGRTAAFDDVQARRAQTYRDLWRVTPAPAPEPHTPRYVLPQSGDAHGEPLLLTLAPGSGARLRFEMSAHAALTPRIDTDPEAPLRLWAAQTRLARRAVSLNLLEPRRDFLRAPADALPISPDAPRLYEGWISAPRDAQAGTRQGRIVFTTPQARLVIPLVVETLAVSLPEASRPAGYYLDEAPHFNALPGGAAMRRRQIACDLAFLRSLSLEGHAPAFSTPLNAGEDAFIVDALAAAAHGVAQPALAYAPAKRARAALGIGGGAARLAQSAQALRALGLAAPIWSVADEPPLDANAAQDLAWWTQALRTADPAARLAAQINHPAQARLLDLVDVAIVNPGFGVDAPDIARARLTDAGEARLAKMRNAIIDLARGLK
jgi:hypothetical protein